MTSVVVEITRFVDEYQPGIVECVLVDAFNQSHTFVEKVPYVSAENLLSDSKYPCAGSINCELEAEFTDANGRLLARVDTDRPDSVESVAGESKFVVLSSQVVR